MKRQPPPQANTVTAQGNSPGIMLTEIVRSGKDELNLIEHPFAVMWDKENQNAVIHHEWDARHPVTGKTLRASWRVEGSPTMGLPKPNDERVYLVLLELTRETHFQNQILCFTRYDLIKRLGWPHNERHYQMLYDAFERLKAVNIVAKNAFWEPRAKSFRNVGFSIIDNFDILNEKPGRKSKKSEQVELPMSYFRWNDVMFQSFQSGYMRTLDLGLALSLKGDIALRLYRYLDKKSYDGRRHFEIELETLCERHLGMRAARYPSKHKERLKGAHDELIARGILTKVVYEPMKSKKAEKVCYSFPSKSQALPVAHADNPQAPGKNEVLLAPNPTPMLAPMSDILQRMLDLKISSDVANQLLQTVSAEQLLLQLDCLYDRAPKDAAAVFVKAVREGWAAPPKYFERIEAIKHAENTKRQQLALNEKRAREAALKQEETASLEKEAARLDTMWEKLDATTRQRIEAEAQQRLGVLGQTGRAQGALVAMRRNLLREKMGL